MSFAQNQGQKSPESRPATTSAGDARCPGTASRVIACRQDRRNMGQHGGLGSCLTGVPPTRAAQAETWSSRGRARHFSIAVSRGSAPGRNPATSDGENLPHVGVHRAALVCGPEGDSGSSLACSPRDGQASSGSWVRQPGPGGCKATTLSLTTKTAWPSWNLPTASVSPGPVRRESGHYFLRRRNRAERACAACWCDSGAPHFLSVMQ